MGRKHTRCEECDKVGIHHFSDKYNAAVCDICLGLPPIKQSAILHTDGPSSLEQAIFIRFDQIFGETGEMNMNPNVASKFSYDSFDKIAERLEELKDELESRDGKPLDNLRQRYRNKQAAQLKKELELEQIRAEAKAAAEAYETEKLQLEKLRQTIDDLSIQKKALYRKNA